MVGLPFAPSRNPLALCIAMFICALALVILAHNAGATDVTGDITVDAFWAPSGNPYMIRSDVTIKSGATLNIEPGTEVKFASVYGLLTEGTGKIAARGATDKVILFTSGRTSPKINDWNKLMTGVSGFLLNCTIMYCQIGVQLQENAIVADCNISAATTGINVLNAGGTLVLRCNVSSTSTAGIALDNAEAGRVTDCIVNGFSEGITLTGSTTGCTITHCTATSFTKEGIVLRTTGVGNRISECVVGASKKGLSILQPTLGTALGDVIVSYCTFDAISDVGIELNVTPTNVIQVRRCIVSGTSRGILLSSATNVQVTECTFKWNTLGARVENCKDNNDFIWKNNIINCTSRATSASGCVVNWDKDGKGNYWGGFAPGEGDENGDGIWDA